MCELCSSNKTTNNNARAKFIELAEMLRKHADQLEKIAEGSLQPHTEGFKFVDKTGRKIVRELVNEWV